MTPEELVDKFEALIANFDDFFQDELSRQAVSLSTETVQCILDNGQSGNGELGRYSTNPLSLDSQEVSRLPRRPSADFQRGSGAYFPGGYFQVRADQGRQNRFVDLSLSGNMYKDLGIVEQSQSGTDFLVAIDGTTGDSVQKLDDNFQRYGDFLKPKREDVEAHEEDFVLAITDLINREID